MIPVHELRVGNLVIDNMGAQFKIDPDAMLHICDHGAKNGVHPVHVTPKFLEGLSLSQMLHIKDLIIIITNEHTGLWALAVKQTGLQIQSVHQLQNFFYANTAMELML